MDPAQQDPVTPFWKSSAGLALLVAALAGGFYLVTEHQAHLYGALPYLILLACPLMHLFMHRGHGGDHQPPASQSLGQGSGPNRRHDHE